MIGCLNPNLIMERVLVHQPKKTTCGKFGKKHYGDCLKGTDNCAGCLKMGTK